MHQISHYQWRLVYVVNNELDIGSPLSQEQKKQLIDLSIRLIENEKKIPNQLYFYHACNSEVAFVYRIYTMLHQMLQANNKWIAFRGLNPRAKQFENIKELIDYYSDHGKRPINDHEPDFHKNASSTNVFVLGNHKTPGECSLSVLTSDECIRSVNLDILLTDLLEPFVRSPQIVQQLLQLYDMYMKETGGVIYQICLPHDEIVNRTYPASGLGTLNPFKGDMNLVSILESLQQEVVTKGTLSKETVDYIKYLQARVLVLPHQPLLIYKERLQKINPDDETMLNKELQTIMRQVFHLILSHINTFNKDYFRDKTPMLRLLPSVCQANDLPYNMKVSDSLLVNAILSNDEALVRNIFQTFPHFLEVKITFQKKHHSLNNCFITMFDMETGEITATPFEVIAFYSNLLPQLLEEFFGGKMWFDHLPAETPCLDHISRLLRVLKKIPEENRSAVAELYKQFIYLNGGLIEVLKLLHKNHKLSFAFQFKQIDSFHLGLVLGCLEKDDQITFALNNTEAIYSSQNVIEIIKILHNKEDKLIFANACKRNIKNANDLICSSIWLDKKNRVPFLQENIDKIENDAQFTQVCTKLKLSEEERTILFDAYHKNQEIISSNKLSLKR